jgi:hypothetical protein
MCKSIVKRWEVPYDTKMTEDKRHVFDKIFESYESVTELALCKVEKERSAICVEDIFKLDKEETISESSARDAVTRTKELYKNRVDDFFDMVSKRSFSYRWSERRYEYAWIYTKDLDSMFDILTETYFYYDCNC